MRAALGLWLILAALPAHALQLELPRNARETASRDAALERVAVPLAPFSDGVLPSRDVEGPVRRRAYRVSTPGLTPLQILNPLLAQIKAAGYEVLLDCNQATCGGFDFRFALDVLPAPNMYVNLRAFHYVSAQDPASGAVVTLLASAVNAGGYLQVIEVGEAVVSAPEPSLTAEVPTDADGPKAPPPGGADLATRLLGSGSAVLETLTFDLGTTTLSDAPSDELAALAALLEERTDLLIAVVGHTDTVGGLDTNIAVSRARAQAVRRRLMEVYGVNGAQVEAEGMGYLAPRASNLTAAGREANRRVEVIVVREADAE